MKRTPTPSPGVLAGIQTRETEGSEEDLATITELSLTSRDLSMMNDDFFLKYKILSKIDFTGSVLLAIPRSLTQCQFLQEINLQSTTISCLPLILAGFYGLRNDPSKIIDCMGDKATDKNISTIIALARDQNQVSIDFLTSDRSLKRISLCPDTTLRELAIAIDPHYSDYLEHILLVRTIESDNIYLLPDETPIAIYQYPSSVWSIELKYPPDTISEFLLPYFRHFVMQTFIQFPQDPSLVTIQQFMSEHYEDEENYFQMLNILKNKCDLLSAAYYLISDNTLVLHKVTLRQGLCTLGDRSYDSNMCSIAASDSQLRFICPDLVFVISHDKNDFNQIKKLFTSLQKKYIHHTPLIGDIPVFHHAKKNC